MFGENVIPIAEWFNYSPPRYGRRSETVFLNFSGAQESISTAYVACGARTKTLFILGS